MNPSSPLTHSGEVVGRYMNNAPVEMESEAVERLIAHVLRRAHLTAEGLDEPNEARAILHLAHSFADELATVNPRFDRLRFIATATEDPS